MGVKLVDGMVARGSTHALTTIAEHSRKDQFELMIISNRKYLNMTVDAQIAYLRARAYPEETKDRLTDKEPINYTIKINPATGAVKRVPVKQSNSKCQSQVHDSCRDALAHYIAKLIGTSVKTEPTDYEVREVNDKGEVISRKHVDLAVTYADRIVLGDFTTAQVKSKVLHRDTVKVINDYKRNVPLHFRNLDGMLSGVHRIIDKKLNEAANNKIRKYRFIFSKPDDDTKRCFFPIVATTDGTLHKSAHDFIECVVSQNLPLQDESAREKLTTLLKSRILSFAKSRYINKPRPLKAVNSYVIPVTVASK